MSKLELQHTISKALQELSIAQLNKLLLLIEFALGIEIAQVIIVFAVLFLGYLTQTLFRFSKRDWIMVISAIVVGLVIPMILNSNFLG
mgnify:CR=1 FL=1